MIVNHDLQYLYIELPHTASTAISRELVLHYGGHQILHKHALQFEWRHFASHDVDQYYVVGSIRHPLDVTVTRYFKLKTDHQGFFSNENYQVSRGGHVSRRDYLAARLISDGKLDFESWLRPSLQRPYDSYGCPRPDDFDYVIRFETIQVDFATFLQNLGLSLVRPLPLVNSTASRDRSFFDYYPPSIVEDTVRSYSPYMQMWGYEFPPDWPKVNTTTSQHWHFKLNRAFKRHLVWNNTPLGPLARSVRRVFRAYAQ